MTTEPKRPPYYDPFPYLLRQVEQALGVLVRFGRHGTYIIKRPSDETMKRLEHAKSAQ